MSPRPRTALAAWATIAAGALGLYFVGYHPTADHPPPLATLAHPLRFGEFVVRFLGAPLVPRPRAAQIVLGIAGLALAPGAAWALVRAGVARAKLAPWLALAGFGVGCALLGAIGRAGPGEGFGPGLARAPRYLTLATPLWLANVVLLLLLEARGRKPAARWAPRAVLAAIVALAAVGSVRQERELRDQLALFRAGRDALVQGDVATVPSDAIAELLPKNRADVALLRERVALLRRRRLGAFATGARSSEREAGR